MIKITEELTKPLLIDGAMSTALEQLGADTNNPLWTASVLAKQPNLVKRVHQEYFKAGARLVITDTYQANVPAFIANGYTEHQAHQLIQRAVKLAKEARDEYQQATGIYNYVAGALGPYGAYLADGSEYTGDYQLSTSEYQQFHRPRLIDILSVGVDVLAIETQPRLDEVLAELELVNELAPETPCYVSFSLKNWNTLADGTPLAVAAQTVAKYNNVFAVGVNCIPLEEVAAAVETVHNAIAKPVIAYPNSSAVYNPQTKTWTYPHGHRSLSSYLPRWLAAGLTIVGGCCTTTPHDIALLHEHLQELTGKEIDHHD
ncbi:homocysteine S-methyltransferase [Limosilactobacillus sp. STM2_1]|uniref:Homocysteine S-methyltransferase n=1 Tax=Limosilactobacillus rudii TaxID=2759755 RepID=A0A7W3UMK9_9LACO|nr:homocysteine S-methyltransferase [Limosilactobacillus rudii]MBB1078793.1 homocysteine S-methyltransferase [Limosilactobacillus rudii]MBB1097655.1 homocysteine S-methyltransferase [Limosilactobacillus rudii]MCD7134764.1 homocysteine S-methyltransferase [Limosilactobacillus rudii]